MIIRLFKSIQTPPLFLIPLLSLLAVYMAFRTNTLHLLSDTNHGPLYSLLVSIPVWQSKWAVFSLVYVVFTSQIYFFNYIINRYEVLYKRSNIPAILFLLLYACIPEFLMLSPFLILNSLIPVLLYSLFGIYKSERPLAFAFDAGFILSLMILFYIPSVLLIPFLFIGIAILRPFSTREWLATLAGIVVPIILMITILILIDNLKLLYQGYGKENWLPVLKFNTINFKYLITGAVIAFILGLSALKLSGNYYKNIIRTRKFQLCFILLFLFLILIIILPVQHSVSRFNLLITPVTLLLSYYFLTIKKNWWFEFLTFLLIGLIIFNNLKINY